MRSAVQDVRYGLRLIRRNPGFATVVVITLALGIGANTAIFSILNALLLRSLPVPEPERLVQIAAIYRNGIPCALLAARLIARVLFAVSTADPATLVVAAIALLCVGALGGYLPARRATRTDPMIALRCE